MDLQRDFLKVAFQQIPFDKVLERPKLAQIQINKEKEWNLLPKKLYLQYAGDFISHRSYEERLAGYYYMVENSQYSGTDLFSCIFKTADELLTVNGGEIQCKYRELLRWRDLYLALGDDLFTTAYLAKQNSNLDTKEFAWPSIISTDNQRLKNILSAGMAENHHHFNGSTQIFPLNWASLMNRVTNRGRDFKRIKTLLHPKTDPTNATKTKLSLEMQCILAADIRLYLFSKLIEPNSATAGLLSPVKCYKKAISVGFYTDISDVQSRIATASYFHGASFQHGVLDYALSKNISAQNNNNNRLLAGERHFLFLVFSAIINSKLNDDDMHLFYAYLLIKNTFRQELVQTNSGVGFSNFKDYQDRKEDFFSSSLDRKYQYEQVRLTLNASLDDPALYSLETRIGPKSRMRKMRSTIKNIHRTFLNDENADVLSMLSEPSNTVTQSIPRYFYVLHFPKGGKETFSSGSHSAFTCRDDRIRKKANYNAKAIVQLLGSDCFEKTMIRGIDTCTTEIGYRPEIFAEAFRRIRMTNHQIKSPYLSNRYETNKIWATNHAGEDFMDLLDGLRAIDESIHFLELGRGDRIGHALALGLKAEDYYESKNYSIASTKQDTLDDLSWALRKTHELAVPIDASLHSKIKEITSSLLSDLYMTETPAGFYTLENYQRAWYLRANSPELYYNVTPPKNDEFLLNPFGLSRIIPKSISNNAIYHRINHDYHYNTYSKQKGSEIFVRKIDERYTMWITNLQEAMQKEMMHIGIGIETNPSSNYLISTFKRYDKHPIFRFNSTFLHECKYPLHVSINTDDQGVFDTSLENEYALLAIALEKSLANKDDPSYNIENIYQWIDYVRQLGINQIFRDKLPSQDPNPKNPNKRISTEW